MANTIIQIKRSTVTTQPGSLTAGEPAYSYLSDKLFLGDASGSVIEIGGRYYINVAQKSWNTANAAFDAANAAFDFANTGGGALYIANLAYDKANSANLLAYNTGIGANAYSSAVGTAANLYAAQVGTSANAYAAVVGTSANAYASAVGVAANTYAATVGTSANAFASATIAGANTAVGAGANAYASAVGVAANTYAATVGTSANAYSDSTFVKLTSASQTITGDLSIVGDLTVSGNTYQVDAEVLRVSDPLIYLAGNNYTSDLVDIGFIANYVNTTGANVHTGFYREHSNKMYYLFQGYDQEPEGNHIDPTANGFTLAVLNADIITSNLRLNGVNAYTFIQNAYAQANTVGTAANSYASVVGTSANLYAATVGTSANLYASAVGVAANAFASATIAGANTAVGTGANAYAAVVGTSANAFASATIAGANTAVGAGANSYASAVGVAANTYADAVGAAANTNAANASYLSTGTVPSARISGSYTGITGVGTLTTGTWNADTITIPYGGTGRTAVTNGAILYGSTSSTVLAQATGSDGNVLQINSFGTPYFGMLDGGVF